MIKHKKLRAIAKRKINVVVSDVSVQDMARELITLRTLCDELYQVVGCLATSAGLFQTHEVERVLDNLAAAGYGVVPPHETLIPFRASGYSE